MCMLIALVVSLGLGSGPCKIAHGACVAQDSSGCIPEDSTSLLQVVQHVTKGSSKEMVLLPARDRDVTQNDVSNEVPNEALMFCNKATCGQFHDFPDMQSWEYAKITGSENTCPTYIKHSQNCIEEKYNSPNGIQIYYRLWAGVDGEQSGSQTTWYDDSDVCESCALKTDGLFDLFDHRIKRNAGYHATVKIGLEDASGQNFAVIVQASPRPIISSASTSHEELRSGQDFSLFVASQKHGYVASCTQGEVYKADSLKIKPGLAFGQFASALNAKAKMWNPATYNCQHFAADVIVHVAADPEETRSLLETLTHDAVALTDSNTLSLKKSIVDATAGIAAGTQGVLQMTGITDVPLADIVEGEAGRYQEMAEAEITSVRLYFTESKATHVLTSSETRKADYDRRQREMCSMISGGSGEMVKTSSGDFDLKGWL